MNLEEVDIGSLQTLEGVVDSAEDGVAGEARFVNVFFGGVREVADSLVAGPRVFADETETFGEDQELFAGDFVLWI